MRGDVSALASGNGSVSSAVVVGASSGVGRALATALAAQGFDLVLLARDARDLEATAADVRLRYGVACSTVVQDIGDMDWNVQSFVETCAARLGRTDHLLVPAGAVSDDDNGANASMVMPIMAANCLGPARLAAAFGSRMAADGGGSIVLFSSIAAAAPRQKNAVYSAAKRALETYAKALRTFLEPQGVRVLVISLGYVDTALSFGAALRFPVATPQEVATYVVKRGLTASGKRHFPAFWWWVTTVLRHLPWFIYRRLSF
jgi:decaprenylphospho-beta-D-erythro-pentofuranosid-2-ulose 2-reductase